MASLNIPFLVFSRSNFVFESNNDCYTGIISQGDRDESNAFSTEDEKSILVVSDT